MGLHHNVKEYKLSSGPYRPINGGPKKKLKPSDTMSKALYVENEKALIRLLGLGNFKVEHVIW